MSSSFSIGFSAEEKAELLELVSSSPKWVERVNGAFGHWTGPFVASDIQPLFWTSPVHPNPAKLPDPLHVGRRVRFMWSKGNKNVYYTGTIYSHYVDGDDCSGTWGELKYGITPDASSGLTNCSVPVKYCELLS